MLRTSTVLKTLRHHCPAWLIFGALLSSQAVLAGQADRQLAADGQSAGKSAAQGAGSGSSPSGMEAQAGTQHAEPRLSLSEQLERGSLPLGILQWQENGAWVRAVGEAQVVGGDVQAARAAAQNDALRNASLAYGTDIQSADTMVAGQLTSSRTTLSTRARATRTVWSDEQLKDGSVLLAVEAFMQPLPLCPASASQSGHLRRSVAMTGFQIQNVHDAGLGMLDDLQRSFPTKIAQYLGLSDRLDPLLATDINVVPQTRNAPASRERGEAPAATLELAEDFGAQFIVSGVIRRLDVESQDAYSSSVFNQARNLLGKTNKKRWFEADLFIHDGFSGALIFQQRYRVAGEYDADRTATFQLGDAAFLAMPYGQAIVGVAREMAADIESNTACQPFMARIAGIDDSRLMLKKGSVSGLKPGDQFQVYRSRELSMNGRLFGKELLDLKLIAKVSHVQPEFSLATLPVNPDRFNVQQGDVVILW